MASAKARYYANQAKKGNITKQQASSAISGKGLNVSQPKTSVASTSSSNPYGAFMSDAQYAENQQGRTPNSQSQINSALAYQKQQSNNIAEAKSSSKVAKKTGSSNDFSSDNSANSTSSNRSLAQGAFNKLSGINTAQASGPKPVSSGTISAPREKGVFERGLEILKDPLGLEPRARALFNDMPWGSKIYQTENSAGDAITQALEGVTPELGISEKYLGDNTGVFSPSENQPYQPAPRPQPVPSPYNSSDSYERSRQNNGGSSRSISSPKQVSNPFVAPSPFAAPETTQIKPQVNVPDYTPQQSQQSGTQRQLLGNGILSNGVASNGKGNYGVEGAMTGTGKQDMGNSPFDEFLMAVGIKPQTAMAAEPQDFSSQPQSTFNFNSSPFGQAVNAAPAFNNQTYNIPQLPATNTSEIPQTQTRSKIEGTGKSIVAQSSQPTSEALKLQQQTAKGYSAQEKAQKKALNELVNSIKKQYSSQIEATNKNYDTQQTQGQSDLEKAKQADLMQLSGLFNFSANQSPDSEQRMQYQQRAQDQANTTLANFLSKLAAARGTDLSSIESNQNKDISSAKQNYQSQLSDIASKKNATQLDIAKMIDEAKQKALDRAAKGGGSTSAGSVTYMGDDKNGNPVYRNSKTGEMITGAGLTRKSDPFTAFLAGQQQNKQGGSWEIDPQTGEKVWVTD